MKIENLKLKIGILIGLFVYLFIGSIRAEAAPLSLTIDPPILEIHAIAPTSIKREITIKNNSDNETNLKIQINPFKAKASGQGEPEYLDKKDSFIIENVKILENDNAIDNINLGPGKEKKLSLNIEIPKNTKSADYYFSTIFISDSTSIPSSTVSLNQLGIAANVLLSVGAKEIPDAVLSEFSSELFFEKGPVPFTIKIYNKGAHFIKPKGEISIKNMFGQNIGKLNLARVNILSDSTREIPQAVWKESFILGYYTATLNLSLSNDGPVFNKSIHFFAFPFQGLIIILIIAIAGIIIKNKLKVRLKK